MNPTNDETTKILATTESIKQLVQALVADKTIPDLSLRQFTVFIKVYAVSLQGTNLPAEPFTVRRLAEDMNVNKPAITRALDRLTDYDYIQRQVDPLDRRSILVMHTSRGSTMYYKLIKLITAKFGIKSTSAKLPEASPPVESQTSPPVPAPAKRRGRPRKMWPVLKAQ